MIENEDWTWSQETLKAIIADIIDRKAKYEKEAETDLDKGIAL